ncbi:hypothetical protein D3C76_1301830 [compost metagenome]
MLSRRLRNSGVKIFLISSIASVLLSWWIRPMDLRSVSRTPALVVITITTLRKSALRPLLSVSVPLSITCSSRLKTSGCAFSISSSSRTACGCLITASVSRPPWSKPTYPGGAPIKRLTVWRSMYSDISKRSSSMPNALDSCTVTSVFPTPVGPANRKEPTGLCS